MQLMMFVCNKNFAVWMVHFPTEVLGQTESHSLVLVLFGVIILCPERLLVLEGRSVFGELSLRQVSHSSDTMVCLD